MLVTKQLMTVVGYKIQMGSRKVVFEVTYDNVLRKMWFWVKTDQRIKSWMGDVTFERVLLSTAPTLSFQPIYTDSRHKNA